VRSGAQTGAFLSIPATALLLSACLAVAGLAACAPRITAPAAEVAAGAVEGTGYRFLHWKEGLAILIWYDFRGDSGSSSASSGGGLGAPSTYAIHGYAESEDGDRFEWEVEMSDGKTARFRLDGESYDLSRGTLFIVSMEHGRADVTQLGRDLSDVEPNHASIVAFARDDADLAPLVGAAPPTPESPVPTPLPDASTYRSGVRFPAPRLIFYPVARFEEVNQGAADGGVLRNGNRLFRDRHKPVNPV
jgi:hypothetical protein